mmetsp:Transcript_41477/g.133837  ORF Transcript_41477/g.133837 Transcript_41477/m.133837 type:complete len:369 (-) Transcript_41477:3443-4549(-)
MRLGFVDRVVVWRLLPLAGVHLARRRLVVVVVVVQRVGPLGDAIVHRLVRQLAFDRSHVHVEPLLHLHALQRRNLTRTRRLRLLGIDSRHQQLLHVLPDDRARQPVEVAMQVEVRDHAAIDQPPQRVVLLAQLRVEQLAQLRAELGQRVDVRDDVLVCAAGKHEHHRQLELQQPPSVCRSSDRRVDVILNSPGHLRFSGGQGDGVGGTERGEHSAHAKRLGCVVQQPRRRVAAHAAELLREGDERAGRAEAQVETHERVREGVAHACLLGHDEQHRHVVEVGVAQLGAGRTHALRRLSLVRGELPIEDVLQRQRRRVFRKLAHLAVAVEAPDLVGIRLASERAVEVKVLEEVGLDGLGDDRLRNVRKH